MAKAKWDWQWEKRAIELSAQSRHKRGRKDHPQVGAVLVNSNGDLIGESFHGENNPCDHAEFSLLEKSQSPLPNPLPSGTTLYTTLEPCDERRHAMPGETQKVSCADRVAERNIQRVVMGMLDPPIDGNGAKKLLKAGKSVEQFHPELGIEARDVNREYMRDAIDVDPQLAAPHSFDIYTAAKLLGLQSSHQSIPLFAHDLAARTKKQQIPHKDTRDYTFWIGCKGTSDRARLAFSTKATSKLPLLFRRLIVAGTPGTGGMPKVADLNLAAGGRASDVVPLETTPEGLALLVLFDPPIGQNPAPWWVSYDWPRLWDPYRDSGTDYGTFEVGKSCSAIKITIRFDAGFKATPDTFSGRYPEVGDLYSATEDGEKVLSWTVEDPEPGRTYSYRIDSDGRPTC